MSECRILGDSAVHDLLIGLSKQEIRVFQAKLEETLKQFSVAEERKYQPDPGVVSRPNGQKVLFRPFTSPSSVGTKIIVDPASTGEKKQPLHGLLVVCDHNGIPSGVMNAEEVTGFRTSLSALICWTRRKHTDHIVVFGSGKQAMWHIRLALALRGDEIKSVVVVNRSQDRAIALVSQIKEENAARWKAQVNINSLDTSAADLGKVLARADAVFCTVPSEQPLFSEHLLNLDARERQPYVSAIGSWRPNMVELSPQLVKRVVSNGAASELRTELSTAVLIVDDKDSALQHAGEIVQNDLETHQLIELGEVLDRIEPANQSSSNFMDWLHTGLVVYKSVGVGLTDLAAGETILSMARRKQVGLTVSDL